MFDAATDVQACETDTGATQIDSLTLDVDATARAAAAFYADFDRRIADESLVLESVGAAAVVGDVPPLAFAAAAWAGVPSVAIANFTWGWIYEAYPSFADLAPHVLDTIRAAYGATTLALRLPLRGGFDWMPTAIDLPLVARRATHTRAEARRRLALEDTTRVALASFGGHGFPLPLDDIAARNALVILQSEPREQASDATRGLVRNLDRDALAACGLGYEDLVAAADVVVTKPGYGIASECIANGTPLLYTSRGDFPEYDALVDEMPRYLRCRHISREDLVNGRWADAIEALVAQPPPPERLPLTGADIAATHILRLADGV